nr:hypothetical protein [Chloroflexota bacterium]
MENKMKQGRKPLEGNIIVKRAYASPKLHEYGRLADLTQGTYKFGYKDANGGSYYPGFFEPKE